MPSLEDWLQSYRGFPINQSFDRDYEMNSLASVVQPKNISKLSWVIQRGIEILKPPPIRTADEWADQKRVLPRGSPEPGPWRSKRTPYMIPIVRACASPYYRRIIVVTGSQMGKTDNLLNVIGHRLDDDPAPLLYVGPTKSNVEKVIEPRIQKMIKGCPDLAAKVERGKRGSKTHKTINGVSLRLAWAGSATELASQDAAYVLLDEIDRMVADVEKEGSPFELAEARIANYPDGKAIGTSTCTIGNVDEEFDPRTRLTRWALAEPDDIQSAIWLHWQEGTRFEWAWPCYRCGDYFIPRLTCLVWPKDLRPYDVARQARLQCPHCSNLITDNHKTEMNEAGTYVAPGQSIRKDGSLDGEVEPNDTASYWVSGLCSPWVPFGRRAKAVVEAARSGDQGKIQVAYNTQLGQLYKLGGESKPWESLRQLIGDYDPEGETPEGIRVITMGVDVQKDRLVYGIRGWGLRQESWGLGYGEIHGDTEFDAVWLELIPIMDKTFGGRPIRLVGIDSGYRPGDKHRTPTNQVYAFCHRQRHRAIPTKGWDAMDKPLKMAKIDVTYGGKTYKAGLQLWHFDTHYFKGFVQGRLDWPDGEPGQWHLPAGTTDDYCQQMCSEVRMVTPTGKVVYVRVRRENHAFDVETINSALSNILQVQHLRPPAPTPVVSAPVSRPMSPPVQQTKPDQQLPGRYVARSKYMQRRR
jgi:phage terminase large subunit GpA-like protein